MIPVHFAPGRNFEMLLAIKKGWDEFRVVGVFSKKEDALDIQAELQQSGLYDLVCAPEAVEMSVILDELCNEKLGPIYNLIKDYHALKKQ